MRLQRIAITVSFLFGTTLLQDVTCVDAGSTAAQQESPLERILSDRQLWGDDAFATFGTLDRWRRAGETSITVYPDKVAAGSSSDTADAVAPQVERMMASMKAPPAALRPRFAALYREARATRAPSLAVESAQFLEDDSFRVVWRREGGEFLRRDVPVRAVFDAHGRPEQTTTEVVHSQRDSRPAVLTVHHYANGAVRFIESDLAPTPGLVDRVVIQIAPAELEIFESGR